MDASKSEARTIGRAAESDQQVLGDSVSSSHCSLMRKADCWWIVDHRSTNGTFVNGRRVSEAPVSDGDRVHLGLVGFTFEDGELHRSPEPRTTGPAAPASGVPLAPRRDRRTTPLLGVVVILGLLVLGVVVGSNIISEESVPPGDEVIADVVAADVVAADEVVDLYAPPVNLGVSVELARNAVVSVRCGPDEGSGWPIDLDGTVYIVTNEHVVSSCVGGASGSVSVVHGSSTSTGVVAGSSVPDDLALVGADTGLSPLPTAALPPIGAWLMVVGNPIGMDRSVTFGTVTNVSEGYLITDASINPGNSGGPVFNSRGEVVAVASAKIVAEDIDRVGIAIPLRDLCRAVVECSSGQWE
jgi:hypothetical protein